MNLIEQVRPFPTHLSDQTPPCPLRPYGNPLLLLLNKKRNRLLLAEQRGITSRMAMDAGLLVKKTEFPHIAATTIILRSTVSQRAPKHTKAMLNFTFVQDPRDL